MRTLVAVDGSKFAEDALVAVGEVARQTGMELTVATVLHPDDVQATFAPVGYVNVPVPTGPPGGKVMSAVMAPPLRVRRSYTGT